MRWTTEKGMMVLNFYSDAHRETPIDILVTAPLRFREEYGRPLLADVAPGVPIRIVSYPTLRRMKREAGRPQDLADLDELDTARGADG